MSHCLFLEGHCHILYRLCMNAFEGWLLCRYSSVSALSMLASRDTERWIMSGIGVLKHD